MSSNTDQVGANEPTFVPKEEGETKVAEVQEEEKKEPTEQEEKKQEEGAAAAEEKKEEKKAEEESAPYGETKETKKQEPAAPGTTAAAYAMVLEDLVLASGSNKILRGVDMAVPSAQLFGILGESGAGKTTLLRLVARKLNESVLTITGAGFLPTEIWYIAQEDVLYEYDTPRRCVAFLHKMLYGSGSHIPGEENVDADLVAEELLDLVRFPMDVIDRPIGTTDDGLSVGARRLLNVAMAICARAKVVMLDEPTTGLDSTTAANLVKTIAEVCHDTGLTAICTIHQPSDEALQHFDSLSVMSEGQAFVPNPDAPTTEKWADAADYSRAELLLLQMKARVLLPSALPTHWTPEQKTDIMGTVDFETQLAKLGAAHAPPFGRQCVLLLERFWIRNWVNVFSFRFRLVISLGLAVMLGFCFWQMPYDDPTSLRDHIGFYSALIGTTFVPIVISAGFFPAEKHSFVHEMSQSKRPSLIPYLLTRSLYDMLVATVASVFFFITMPMVGVEGRWATFWFSMVLQSFCSDSFGFALSIRFDPAVSIGALIPAIGFPSMLMGTGLVSPPKVDAGWIFHVLKWGTFFKYGFTAMVVEQFPLMSGTCTPFVDDGCFYSDWQNAMDVNEIDRTEHAFISSYAFNWMMLGILYFAFRALILIQLNGLVAASKYTYKSATNWEVKKKKDKERVEVDPEAAATAGGGDADAAAADGAEKVEKKEAEAEEEATVESVVVVVDSAPAGEGTAPEGGDKAIEMMIAPEPKKLVSVLGGLEKLVDITLRWDMHVVASHSVGLLDKETETILAPQTGYAMSGEVLGILGPGSSGKTALLKVLSRMLPINGYEADQSNISISCDFNQSHLPDEFPGTRFVYQYDAFVPGDTVTSAVMRQLELAMNHTEVENPKDMMAAACTSILKSMGLGHIVDKKAVEISGGQMRRLSIACQIAHNPRILLLDEPTSGLDSELALECMEALRRFATNSNAVVICTLNQPGKRLLPTVDRFLFMQQGDAIFEGALFECQEAFGATAGEIGDKVPTDVILSKLRAIEVAEASAKSSPMVTEEGGAMQPAKTDFKALMPPCPRVCFGLGACALSLHCDNAHDTTTSGFGAFASRLGILLRRNMSSRVLNNPTSYFAEMTLKMVAFPVVVAIMFAQVEDPTASMRFAIAFMVLTGVCFAAMVSPVVVFAAERVPYDRERRANDYSPATYILARWISDFIPDALFGLLGFGLLYGIVGFDGNFGIFYATMIMAFYACVGLALAIAVLPFPVFVNCGFASFSTIVFFLSADFLCTPAQIEVTWFLHLLEVFNPMRSAAILQFFEETSHTAAGTTIMSAQLGLNRETLDDKTFLWLTLAASLLLFRLIGLFVAVLLHWVDTATVRKMHPVMTKECVCVWCGVRTKLTRKERD